MIIESKLEEHTLISSDYPNQSKQSEVCSCYKEHIPLIKRDYICTFNNCLVMEILSQIEKCFLTCIYHSPSQNHDKFQNFCLNFDALLNDINNEFSISSVVTSDFIARNQRWWKNDITNSADL